MPGPGRMRRQRRRRDARDQRGQHGQRAPYRRGKPSITPYTQRTTSRFISHIGWASCRARRWARARGRWQGARRAPSRARWRIGFASTITCSRLIPRGRWRRWASCGRTRSIQGARDARGDPRGAAARASLRPRRVAGALHPERSPVRRRHLRVHRLSVGARRLDAARVAVGRDARRRETDGSGCRRWRRSTEDAEKTAAGGVARPLTSTLSSSADMEDRGSKKASSAAFPSAESSSSASSSSLSFSPSRWFLRRSPAGTQQRARAAVTQELEERERRWQLGRRDLVEKVARLAPQDLARRLTRDGIGTGDLPRLGRPVHVAPTAAGSPPRSFLRGRARSGCGSARAPSGTRTSARARPGKSEQLVLEAAERCPCRRWR